MGGRRRKHWGWGYEDEWPAPAELRGAWDDGKPDPYRAFENTGRAYLHFARTEPAYYSAMFEAGVALEGLLDRVPDVVGSGIVDGQLDLVVEADDAGDVAGHELGLGALVVERGDAGEPLFANPRNAAAGTMRNLEPSLVAKRGLSAFTYQVVGSTATPGTRSCSIRSKRSR